MAYGYAPFGSAMLRWYDGPPQGQSALAPKVIIPAAPISRRDYAARYPRGFARHIACLNFATSNKKVCAVIGSREGKSGVQIPLFAAPRLAGKPAQRARSQTLPPRPCGRDSRSDAPAVKKGFLLFRQLG